jgi:lysophospholipase L1-like esterase
MRCAGKSFTKFASMIRLPCLILAGLAAVASQPALAAGEALDAVDCSRLKVDFVRMMPEIVEPGTFVPPDPPFAANDLKQLEMAAALDPNGLCHYREANRVLPVATRDRVVFIGDSITEYWAIADPGLFYGEVIGRGISAQNTSQMLLRFRHDVIALQPRAVHILAGINDAMAPNGTATTRANIISMVELARVHRIKVILGTLTPADSFWLAPEAKLAPFVAEHNRWLREYAAREHIALVNYHAALAGPDSKIPSALANDGLHPNRLGYAKMGPPLRKALQALGIAVRKD